MYEPMTNSTKFHCIVITFNTYYIRDSRVTSPVAHVSKLCTLHLFRIDNAEKKPPYKMPSVNAEETALLG